MSVVGKLYNAVATPWRLRTEFGRTRPITRSIGEGILASGVMAFLYLFTTPPMLQTFAETVSVFLMSFLPVSVCSYASDRLFQGKEVLKVNLPPSIIAPVSTPEIVPVTISVPESISVSVSVSESVPVPASVPEPVPASVPAPVSVSENVPALASVPETVPAPEIVPADKVAAKKAKAESARLVELEGRILNLSIAVGRNTAELRAGLKGMFRGRPEKAAKLVPLVGEWYTIDGVLTAGRRTLIIKILEEIAQKVNAGN